MILNVVTLAGFDCIRTGACRTMCMCMFWYVQMLLCVGLCTICHMRVFVCVRVNLRSFDCFVYNIDFHRLVDYGRIAGTVDFLI